jgi:hypothetical protein
MTLPRFRKYLVAILGLLAVFGTSLSALHAADMQMKMSIMSGMDMSGKGKCEGCESGDGGKATACVPHCVAPAFALLPSHGVAKISASLVIMLSDDPKRRGAAYPPDPPRPRTFHIV